MASCPTVPPKSRPCSGSLYQDAHFNGFVGVYSEGRFDLHDLETHGLPNDEGTSLLVEGDDCVVTLYSEQKFSGIHGTFQAGSYEAEDLTALGLNDDTSSLIVKRQPLQLSHSNGKSFTTLRTMVDGVVAWTDQKDTHYLKVPEELVGATLFAGPSIGTGPAGNLNVTVPR